MTKIGTSLIACLAIAGTMPAAAGAPDKPGFQGQIVRNSIMTAQGESEWSGGGKEWGQVVSSIANGSNLREDRKLGQFLKEVSGGPNPKSDSGSGND